MILYYSFILLSITVPMGFVIATRFKLWKECFAGYIVIIAFLLLLIAKLSGLIPDGLWAGMHLLTLNIIVLFVIAYSLFKRHSNKSKKRRHYDKSN